MGERLPPDQRFMMQARNYAEEWSTCPRAKVGAVIVLNGKQESYGYNGAPEKMPHCTDVGCLMENSHCRRATHAEDNALWYAGRERTKGAVLYTTHFPCWDCSNKIIRAKIREVVYDNEYRVNGEVLQMLRFAGVDVRRIEW